MNTLVQNRIVWKEMRELTPLFIAGCVAFLITLLATCYSWSGLEDIVSRTFLPVNMFTNICGLVIGVLIFAPEKEQNTSQFLGGLPTKAWYIAMSKALLGLLYLISFMAFCYMCVIIVGLVAGQTASSWPPRWELINNLLVPFECFAWGLFWSLTIRSTLFALLFAAASVLLTELLVNLAIPEWFGLLDSQMANPILAWGIRSVLLIPVFFQIARSFPNWLKDEQRASIGSRRTRAVHQLVARRQSPNGEPRGAMTSLIWQSFRQSRAILMAGTLVCVLIAIGSHYLPAPEYLMIEISCAAVMVLFVSSQAFAPDQKQHRYRFFQQQSEYGRKLWLARLLPSALLVVLATVCTTLGRDSFMMVVNSGFYNAAEYRGFIYADYALPHVDWIFLWITPMKIILILFTAMAIGQFFSMMISSPIVSMVSAQMYGALAAAWTMILLACSASLWLFLLPVALLCLFVTWQQSPHWLAERKTTFDNIIPWLSLGLVAAILVGGFAVHRYVEVPKLPATLKPAIHLQASYETLASKRYLEALENMVPIKTPGYTSIDSSRIETGFDWDTESDVYATTARIIHVQGLDNKDLDQFVESNRKPLKLIHEASKLEQYYAFLNPGSYIERRTQARKLQTLLMCEAEYWLRRDDLDKALRSLLALLDVELRMPMFGVRVNSYQLLYDWSEWPGQTPNTIKDAIAQIESRVRRSTMTKNGPHARSMKMAYRHLDFQDYKFVDPLTLRLLRWMPWEAERAKRVGEHLIENTDQLDRIVNQVLQDPRRCLSAEKNVDQIMREGRQQSPYLGYARTSLIQPGYELTSSFILKQSLKEVQLFRYAIIRMALSAWRLDHDDYPRTLDALAPEYIVTVPCDAYSGGGFYFSPTGLDYPVVWASSKIETSVVSQLSNWMPRPKPTIETHQFIPENTPFLLPWSSDKGQTTREVALQVTSDDGLHETVRGLMGDKVEPRREQIIVSESKMRCYEVSAPQSFVSDRFFGLNYKLPKIDKAD